VSETTKIRVLVVDDHALARSGLAAFLMAFDDLELSGAACNGAEAVRRCAQLQPDVVLMDLMMPEMDGATATRLIRQQCPHTKVVVLTSFKDEALVQGALLAGATSYLLKDVSAGALADTIRRAHAGHATLAPEAAEALIHTATHPDTLGHDLTTRERDILAQMVRGLNNSEIAKQLVVSRSTVKFHVSNILSKFGVGGRTEAVALAVQHHLVT
jgi:two-component system, NarL family, response regulator LiaR